MEISADIYLIFLSLSIVYTICLIFCISRVKGFFRFLPEWRSAKLLYYFLLVQILMRVISFWSICIFSEQIQLRNSVLSFILLTLPDTLLTSSLLVLLWIMIMCNIFTRIESDDNNLPIGTTSYLYRAAVITLKVLLAWIALEIMLYGFLALDSLKRSTIMLQQCLWMVLASVAIISASVYLQFKYSGIPFKSQVAAKEMKRVNLAAFVWSIGRLIHTILLVVRESELNNPEELNEISDNTLPLIVTVIDFLCSELLCYYLVMRASFYKTFLPQEFAAETISLVDRNSKSFFDRNSEDNFVVELQETSSSDSGVLINKEIFNQKGKLGTLYEGISNNTTVVVRRLILNRISAYVIEKLEEEINDMKSITNPYLMTNIRVVIKKPTQNKTFDIIMPHISGGSLYSALHEKKLNFSLQKKVELAREIAFSMKLLHDQGRIHGHLTPHNILLDSRNILVSDLGMVHLKKYVGLLGNYSNKSAWSSPEVLKEGGNVVIKATTHDDVYSFGMILWEIMTEQEPFPDYSLKKLKEMVGEQGYRPALEEFEVPGVQELIKSCWNINPQSRPTFHLVFSTLNGLISSNLEAMMG